MEVNREILVRYFRGQCSENEKEIIEQWLKDDQAHEKQFIRERIRFDAALIAGEERRQAGRIKTMTSAVLKAASIALLLVAGSYFLGHYTAKPDAVCQNVYVPPGNRISLTLPDGSSVWLNSNSSLKYPSVFNGRSRTVELDGEAYFEVKSDRKAFVVQTGKYNIEVLGTTFDVEAYSGKPGFKTALFTGKVKLYHPQNENESLLLNAGETAELDHGALQVHANEMSLYRWQDGLIIIEEQSFEEIMELFEKHYGQRIIIRNDHVKHLGYRGKLRIADGIDHALQVLQKDFNFKYSREDDTSVIYID